VQGSRLATPAARRRHGDAAAWSIPEDGVPTACSGPVYDNVGHESGSGRASGGMEGPASVRHTLMPPQLCNTIPTAAVH